MTHPARYSAAIIAALTDILPAGIHIHDPYAGTGERLGDIADRRGWTYSGTEIEAGFIVDPRVKQGDSTQAHTYPLAATWSNRWIVTSPVYPNGMADHWNAADSSDRHTYRAAAGHDLDTNNMGRYGYRGGSARNHDAYWLLAGSSVRWWDAFDGVIVNVSDFIAAGQVVPIVAPWRALLASRGWQTEVREVVTPRQRRGANGGVRVDAEALIIASAP